MRAACKDRLRRKIIVFFDEKQESDICEQSSKWHIDLRAVREDSGSTFHYGRNVGSNV